MSLKRLMEYLKTLSSGEKTRFTKEIEEAKERAEYLQSVRDRIEQSEDTFNTVFEEFQREVKKANESFVHLSNEVQRLETALKRLEDSRDQEILMSFNLKERN